MKIKFSLCAFMYASHTFTKLIFNVQEACSETQVFSLRETHKDVKFVFFAIELHFLMQEMSYKNSN